MASVRIYPGEVLNPVDRKILGHFVEQFPGNIPGGIYDPSHPLADETGHYNGSNVNAILESITTDNRRPVMAQRTKLPLRMT